jgi:hypothetical protein
VARIAGRCSSLAKMPEPIRAMLVAILEDLGRGGGEGWRGWRVEGWR